MALKKVCIEIDSDDYFKLKEKGFDVKRIGVMLLHSFVRNIDGDINLIADIQHLYSVLKMNEVNGSDPKYTRELKLLLELKQQELKEHRERLEIIADLRKIDALIVRFGPDVTAIRKNGAPEIKRLSLKTKFDLNNYVQNRVLEDMQKGNPIIKFIDYNRKYKKKESTHNFVKQFSVSVEN